MNITKCKECGCTKDAEDRVSRLQTRVEEAEAWEGERESYIEEFDKTCKERDGYKARDKLRGEALKADVKWFVKQWEFYMNCGQLGAAQEVSLLLDDARAAIATPE
ncbi:hypothetical protein LCGC14_1971820, partial [marine sediment metagenome]